MSILMLRKLLPPPTIPFERRGSLTWDNVEQELGIRLPQDYKLFIDSYGTGSINDFILIFTPFTSHRLINLIERGRNDLEGFGGLRQSFPELYQHDRFPATGGILPFASTDNGELLYWKTDGDPEKWPVLAYESRGPTYFNFAGCMTEFLIAILNRSIDCGVFPNNIFNQSPKFTPLVVG